MNQSNPYVSAGQNPLDVLESLFMDNDWPFHRGVDQGLYLETAGSWCDYQVYFAVNRELDLLYATCAYDLRIPQDRRHELMKLLASVNREMWMGHFDLCSENGAPTYRHSLPIRGVRSFSREQLEDLLDHALSECERFYPAFQAVLFGHIDHDRAVRSAMIECQGMA